MLSDRQQFISDCSSFMPGHISHDGKVVGNVCPFVCPFVSTLSFEPTDL